METECLLLPPETVLAQGSAPGELRARQALYKSLLPPTEITCILPDKQHTKILKAVPWMPQCFSFPSRMSWKMILKALHQLHIIRGNDSLFSKTLIVFSTNNVTAVTVEKYFLKSCWAGEVMFLFSRNLISCSFITALRVLSKTGRFEIGPNLLGVVQISLLKDLEQFILLSSGHLEKSQWTGIRSPTSSQTAKCPLTGELICRRSSGSSSY